MSDVLSDPNYKGPDPEVVEAMSKHPHANFKAANSRSGTIAVIKAQCNVCLRKRVVIAIDSSEGEYGPGCICQLCAKKAFEKGVQES